MPLVRRLVFDRPLPPPHRAPRIATAGGLARLVRAHVARFPQEIALVVPITCDSRVLGVVEVAVGVSDAVQIDSRVALAAVLIAGVRDFAMVHSHPQGSARPSRQDDTMTKSVLGFAELLDLNLVDHVIVAGNDYFSYAEHAWNVGGGRGRSLRSAV